MGSRPLTDPALLRRLLAAGRAITSQLDIERVLAELLEIACEVTSARYGAIGVLTPTGSELERFLTRGLDDRQQAQIGDPPRGRGVLGVLISDPRPLRLSSLDGDARSSGFPPGHPPMTTFLGAPIMVRGEAWGNLYLTDKDGGVAFTDDDEEAVVVLAHWAAIAIHNTRLYEDADARRDALELVLETLAATSAFTRSDAGGLGPVLELIARRSEQIVNASAVTIALLDGHRLRCEVSSHEGQAVGEAIDDPVLTDVVQSGQPRRIIDVSASAPGLVPVLGPHAGSAALVVPLTFRGRHLGVLIAVDRRGHDPQFGAEDETVLQSFAASAATAVAAARSVDRDRVRGSLAAAERERQRWARELHDETLQGLGALRLGLATALRGDDEDLRASVAHAVDGVGDQIAELRGLIAELRPASLDALGLRAALEQLVERFGAHAQRAVKAAVTLDGLPARLDPELETTIYRLAQEALQNIAKHAQASEAVVQVVGDGTQVTLTVTDNGSGGASPHAGPEHFGITGMIERATLAGGTLTVDSPLGGGTRIRAQLPLRLRADESVLEGVGDELGPR